MNAIRTVGLVGTGVIGAGWAARLLFHGVDVIACDPAPGADPRLRDAIERAWPAMQGIDPSKRARGELRVASGLEDLCAAVDFIQESAPEREDLKRALLARIDALAPPEVTIASSSSGLLPSRLQADCRHPGRIVVGHPFNPVYLLPLVEVLGGECTGPAAIGRSPSTRRSACSRFAYAGRSRATSPIACRRRCGGRHCTWSRTASPPRRISTLRTRGPGLRWGAFMGVCLTFHLAGGQGGMRHMLAQFGPALELPWTKLEAPPLTDSLAERLIAGRRPRLPAARWRISNDCATRPWSRS